MVITPRISEKSYGLSRQNIYVFRRADVGK